MATNVSEKDKTLNEIIEWSEKKWQKANHEACYFLMREPAKKAYAEVIEHCKAMLGYSGSMPSEVPNQSEDAKMVYLIVANTDRIIKKFTGMDEAFEEACHYAPKLGDIVVVDATTSKMLIVTADGKAIDMDANMRAVNR